MELSEFNVVNTKLRSIAIGILLVAASLALTGCGGGGGDAGTGTAAAPPSAPPSALIGGTPGTQAMEGQPYSFQPTIVDPGGASLSFSIDNPPEWADFDIVTGLLTGVPELVDVGTSSNIQISATDGTISDVIGPFSITVNQAGTGTGAVTLSWLPPTQNADGSTLDDLGGYRIRYGTEQDVYPNTVPVDAGLSSVVINGLMPDTYFFVATAYDQVGNESEFSNVATVSIN